MFLIVKKEQIAQSNYSYWIKAPDIAFAYKAGQFLILRINEKGERIPLTIVDTDLRDGLIRIIFSVVGKSSYNLSMLNEGDTILDVVGPLGMPTHIEQFGHAVIVGGGVGIAPVYPIAKEIKNKGNVLTSILGGRTKELVILRSELKKISEKLIIVTDDGALGEKGLVTDPLNKMIEQGVKIDFVLAVGPLVMMSAVSELTRKYGIKTMVSLNTMMVDGTGMCGCCRCTVDGKTRFACVHGPEFDGHKVDFKEIMQRQKMFYKQEAKFFNQVKEQKNG
ncbi:sulfide/dihydroorotate dehydrogenase-like FAD/NAD-binding protein [bacterium]|nr:sulfide/dihydroorotate dehydrogenase-like FAD/NAD-binding protein [bacterium]